MNLDVFLSVPDQAFTTKVVGVTKRNSDGSDRQQLLSRCRAGQRIQLKREHHNTYDRYAVAVHLASGAMIGYVPAGDARLAEHMDRGGGISAKIVKVIGGRTWWQKLLQQRGKTIGCVIEVTKRDFDWEKVRPYLEANAEISSLVTKARELEKTDKNAAVEKYRDAIDTIKRLDAQGAIAAAWRTARYPIFRLSLTLDRAKRKPEALSAIRDWEQYSDPVGIPKNESESISKRKLRLEKAGS